MAPLFTIPENDFIKYEMNYRQLGKRAAKMLIRKAEESGAEETTAQAAAESSAVADISAVPATGDMTQTGQWVLLGAASLAAIGISLETRRKKRK